MAGSGNEELEEENRKLKTYLEASQKQFKAIESVLNEKMQDFQVRTFFRIFFGKGGGGESGEEGCETSEDGLQWDDLLGSFGLGMWIEMRVWVVCMRVYARAHTHAYLHTHTDTLTHTHTHTHTRIHARTRTHTITQIIHLIRPHTHTYCSGVGRNEEEV